MKYPISLLAILLFSIVSPSLRAQKETPLFEKEGLKIYELKGSPAFADATLELESPANGAILQPESDTFQFKIKNYTLGAQTPDASKVMCANSSKGQHIHFILDNEPYVASYDSTIITTMKPGHHVLLAFLSRSYHESIKHKKAYVLRELNSLDAEGKMPFTPAQPEFGDIDADAPHMFYSRPKGEYIGPQETKRVMLDFYLVNCLLSPTGYKVRATINGTQFTFTKWAPYIIEGLPLGTTKIKLELLDERGNLAPSPYNGVERVITLRNEGTK